MPCVSQLRSSSVLMAERHVPPYWPISACGSTTNGLVGRRSSTGGRSPASTLAARDGASGPFGTAFPPPFPLCAGTVSKNEHPASEAVAARPPPVSSSDRRLTAVDESRSRTLDRGVSENVVVLLFWQSAQCRWVRGCMPTQRGPRARSRQPAVPAGRPVKAGAHGDAGGSLR